MNTEQTSKNIFMYIKTHYYETILAKIQALERKLWLSIHLILIIYDFLFVVIATRFYQKIYNLKVESRLNEVKQFYIALVNLLQEQVHINHFLRKETLSATNITEKKVITVSSRQLTHIKTELLAKGLNFSLLKNTI